MTISYNKGFSITAMFMAIAAFFGIGAHVANNMQATTTVDTQTQVSQTMQTSSASDWKTYTNSQYGFQFSYPATWNVMSGTHYGGGIHTEPGYIQFSVINPSDNSGPGPAVAFSVQNSQYNSIQDFMNAEETQISSNPNVKDKWSVTEGNFLNLGEAVFVTDKTGAIGCKPTGTLSESVFIVKNGLEYIFDDYRCNDWSDAVKKMMNTFKLIPINSTQSASYNSTNPNMSGGLNVNANVSVSSIKIASITPTAGPAGTRFTLAGNFNENGFGGPEYATDIVILDSATEEAYATFDIMPVNDSVSFVIPATMCAHDMGGSGKPCDLPVSMKPGKYYLYYQNTALKQMSNIIPFTITTN